MTRLTCSLQPTAYSLGPTACSPSDLESPQDFLAAFANLAVSNLNLLRNYINNHRADLTLDDVVDALDEIDAARRAISINGLADTPLVRINQVRSLQPIACRPEAAP